MGGVTPFVTKCYIWLGGVEKTQFLTLPNNLILEECKKLPDLSVMSMSTLHKCCRKLEVSYKLRKKVQVYQRFDVDAVLPACNFIKKKASELVFSSVYNFNKNKTPTPVLSCKF